MKEHLKDLFSEAVQMKEKGELESSKQILFDLAQRDPESPAILAVLGDVCWDMRLLDEAVTAFQRAIELRPRVEGLSLALFHCLWELGRREEALEETKRFMSISDSEDYREIVREINEKYQ